MTDSDIQQTTCTFCDARFDTVEERQQHEVEDHPMTQVEELERLVDTFEDCTDAVQELQQEKERLETELERLRTEQGIEETMATLQESARRLQEQRQDRREQLAEHVDEVELHDADDPIQVAATVEGEEVELVDPDAAAEDEPRLRAVNDTKTSEVPPWTGFEPGNDNDDEPVDDQVRKLQQEDAALASLRKETEDVLHRLQRRTSADESTD